MTFCLARLRFSRQRPSAIKAAPATADATPAAMGTTLEDACVVPSGAVVVEAGEGAGVAGVEAGKGDLVEAGGVAGGADVEVDGGAGVIAGEDDGAAADGGAVVEEGVSKALVLSITATKSPPPWFVAANDPYVIPTKRTFPSESADSSCR